MKTITVPAENLTVIEETDVCVIGGSCTGVFAAVRAAKLGARVAIVEKQNRFGGVATTGLVCMWHSLFDSTKEKQIIGGLTFEMMERLEKRNAIAKFRNGEQSVPLNTEELTLELDAMITEQKNIRTFFHTIFSKAIPGEDGKIKGIVIENKSGRFVIFAKVFIDASGDGLLCRDAGFPMWSPKAPQPPTACAHIENYSKIGNFDFQELVAKNRTKYPELPYGFTWGTAVPGSENIYMLAATRILNCDCADADKITEAEFASRKQIRAIMNILTENYPEAHLSLQALPSAIGIRETCHIVSEKQLTGVEMLADMKFPDTIGAGTYPVDIHGTSDDSITFKRLNGDYQKICSNKQTERGRWLPEGTHLPYYRIPLSALIPKGSVNLISAGRMLDADADAFGAIRVMLNLNQCGEAAGVAAVCAMEEKNGFQETNPEQIRTLLRKGGSIIPE